MPYIQIGLSLNPELGLKSVSINFNDTGLPDDSELIKKIAIVLLTAISMNSESVKVQDLLNELGIQRSL